MSPLPDIVQGHDGARGFSPFESWVRQSLRNRFAMVSNKNLPPEILLQIDTGYEAPLAHAAGRTGRR